MTDGDGDTATATVELPGDGRQRADAPARRRLRSTTTGCAGGNPASTTGDLDANVGDNADGDTSEATFTGALGGSVGGRRRRRERLLASRASTASRHGRPGDGDLQLECRQQHADRDHVGGTRPARRCSRCRSPMRRPAPTR